MKEYTIICIYNGGTPFELKKFSNVELAKNKIYEMIQLEEQRKRIYFVDNDFFENKYPIGLQSSKYFCIQEREVYEWKKYEKHKEISKEKNNILIFKKKVQC